jgi:RNA polymerase sigma-70 factor, ECF subfamily
MAVSLNIRERENTPMAAQRLGFGKTTAPLTKSAPEEDRVLAEKAADGNLRAFEALYARHSGRVYALCLRMTGNRLTAEESTQDAFVHAWERLSSFRGESAFGSWLHRIAVNVVLETARRQKRLEARVVTPGEENLRDHGTTPKLGVRMDLEAAIAALPRGARTVFVLHDVEGYPHREIATLMEISAGTSKAHLHRARRLLREALAQ